jgi:hypothetical protein
VVKDHFLSSLSPFLGGFWHSKQFRILVVYSSSFCLFFTMRHTSRIIFRVMMACTSLCTSWRTNHGTTERCRSLQHPELATTRTTLAARHDFNSTTPTMTLQPRLHEQAKCQFLIKYFMASIYFVDLLYMPWLLFRSLPLDMLGGLAMPTRRSPDLRVQFFLSCAMSPSPLTCSGASPCQSKGRQTCGVIFLLCVLPLTA